MSEKRLVFVMPGFTLYLCRHCRKVFRSAYSDNLYEDLTSGKGNTRIHICNPDEDTGERRIGLADFIGGIEVPSASEEIKP